MSLEAPGLGYDWCTCAWILRELREVKRLPCARSVDGNLKSQASWNMLVGRIHYGIVIY